MVSCKTKSNINQIESETTDTENKEENLKFESVENINEIPKKVEQNISDVKVVLSKPIDSLEQHLYGRLDFLIDNKLRATSEYDNLKIEGYQDNVCAFFHREEKGKRVTYYILKLDKKPKPNGYLIYKKSNEILLMIAEITSNTADIFGDVDFDGKFEIGGFNNYCKNGKLNKYELEYPLCNIDSLEIIEIGGKIQRDTTLENLIKKNKNVW